MIDWEKRFDEKFQYKTKDFHKPVKPKDIKIFIRKVLEEQENQYANWLEVHEQGMKDMYKRLRLDEKELDKILCKFYEHMCGVDDYGCELCLKYKQQILDLQGEK